MFDAKRTQNAIKYLKECEGSLKLPQTPYKIYYNKCVNQLEQDIRVLCFIVLMLIKDKERNKKKNA